MRLQTPLGRVRGLGSAKEGTGHFIAQRVSALALIPLLLWFVASIISLAGKDYVAVSTWVKTPFVTVTLILLILATVYHAVLGLQIVIEDYFHIDFSKFVMLIFIKLLAVVIAVAGIVAVLRIALGG
ncbi:succinate dehydrogenase, hydrophobic membrane anchor protein [Beggiatoa leptomitoformis]|uniref:Succinate dehydrogenase hydrophobic membrane anchor subunit n=1 Tax=Beggiatoa leptomitoformis TaxID=288004 RepID=A0A2N9YA43_9GAMM|nr:succinate dehydrogenase, hydrophobic membrane anchor protein [Beggiatoa leptomitoformis]ALG67259.1 succinate dehydrogenase, hydrophobic membrane anchor protein [Beggiatoa leptomitoformis]AUI67318.1 succinate dehydrogenase, hydrophobic membrane anchor protein [Beggiatoa leptomitoformis]